jgi:hypothetical protein
MRALVIATIILSGSSFSSLAVVRVPLPDECNDRNALQNVAYDARLTAVQFYYKGYIQNLTDKKQRVCYEARVLMDDGFAVINQTRMLVEANWLPIDVAAQVALKGLCTEAAP